ncbi:MAG: glycoside-pentoside-hexuronide (GPH):cation symporter [Oscillospiraceae bacterium]|jgi:GPH family glycoside/pentoside/hexuronide:cation symporter|nr:glycoside-pentoside-hexuronide (GPH):cation symporter [Oscillospiraceae bacterium]
MNTETKKFGIKDQVAYMFGDVGGNFVSMYVDGFFLVFCTFVLNISPFFMGTLFLIARTWDAFSDPIIGSLPDRYLLGKSGDRFKPYIKLSMMPLVVSGLLAFTNVSVFPDVLKYIWICVAYLLADISYTGTSMPYGSLASVISADPVERTKLSRARSIGGLFVAVVLAVVPFFIWTENAEGTQDPVAGAFFVFALIFGVFSLLAFWFMLKNTTERIKYSSSKKDYKYSRVIKGILKSRPMIGAMVATIGSMISLTGITQFGTFLWREYYNQPEFVAYMSVATLPFMLILFPFLPGLVRRFGKRATILAPVLVGFAISIVIVAVPFANPWVFFAFALAATFGNMVFAMLVWALVTDCLDFHEKITGDRNDGSVFSIFTFARKVGSAIASTVGSFVLGFIGFNEAFSVQTTEVAQNIRTFYAAIPLVSNILIIIGLGVIYNMKNVSTQSVTVAK